MFTEKEIINKFFKFLFWRLTAHLKSDAQFTLKLAAKLILRYRLLLVGVMCAGIGAAVFEGGTMGLLGLAVSVLVDDQTSKAEWLPDRVAPYAKAFLETTSRQGVFLFLTGIAVVAQILKSSFTYVSQVTQIYLAAAMAREAKRLATTHVMSLSYGEISKYPSGRTAILIDQADCVSELVNEVSNLSRAGFMLIAYITVMIMLSLNMTAVTVVVIGILWLALTRVVYQLRRLSDTVTSAKLDVWRWTVEYLNAPRLLRLFNGTEYAEKIITENRDTEIYTGRTSDVIMAAIKPAMEVITIFGAGFFLIAGYLFAGAGAASAITKLFVFVLIIYRLKPQVTIFTDFRIKMARLLPMMEVLGDFLRRNDKEFSRVGGKSFGGLKQEIEFQKVEYKYPESSVTVLRNISFTIPAGKTIALVGVSGGGKSTMADLLLGLYTPTRGKILVDGIDLSEIDLLDWRNHIGIVDQEVFLLNASIKDNIGFARSNVKEKTIEKAARIAHAHEFIVNLEAGYETIIGDRGHKLSGGQQQRLALARALLGDPAILVLDEATSSLDTISEKLIQRALKEMRNSRTVLIIAHRLSTIADADHIIVIDNGQITEEGSKVELLRSPGAFSRLWNLQADIAT